MHLTFCNRRADSHTRGRITDVIPAVIIQHICEELEPVSTGEARPGKSPASVAARKHLKNRDVRAVSHVCRSWRLRTTALMCLWQDIAFDVTEPKTIRLAADFFSLVKGSDVPLRIYVEFGNNDLPDPGIASLFEDLRNCTSRWVTFEYQGALGEYSSYLDLPAPNLRRFLAHGDSTWNASKLFAGCTHSLRHLLASSTLGWDLTALPNLVEFHLNQPTPGQPPSLNSILGVLRSAPRLETLRIEQLGSFVHDCEANANVPLLHLHTLQVHNTDLDALAEHIVAPNVRNTTFTADGPAYPLFQAPHALTGLSSMLTPNQPVSEVLVVVAHTEDGGGTFRIRLTAPSGSSSNMCLTWDVGAVENWKENITEALSALATRVSLDPGVILRLYVGTSTTQLPSHVSYKIHGGFARRFFQMLADDATPLSVPLPFRCGLWITNDVEMLDEDETQMFRLCLRSREACNVGILMGTRHGSLPWFCATGLERPRTYYPAGHTIAMSDPRHR